MQELLEQMRILLQDATETVYYFRTQNMSNAYLASNRTLKNGQCFIDLAAGCGLSAVLESLLPVFEQLLDAMEQENELLLADLYENRFVPACLEIQAVLVEELSAEAEPHIYWYENMSHLKKKDYSFYKIMDRATEREDRAYSLGWTATGEMALYVSTSRGNVQLHSVINPWQEALLYAKSQVEVETDTYIVVGFGLGYHVEALMKCPECKRIIILEHDLEQLRIALRYRDMSKILSGKKLTLIYCGGDEALKEQLEIYKTKGKILLWAPSVKTLENMELRNRLENYLLESVTARNMLPRLNQNFQANQKLQDVEVTALKNTFKGRDVILVAGGPSVDEALPRLKELQSSDTLIVAVGKVVKKLLLEDITPDYFVMIDAKPGTKWQIDGVEECGIPLIYLSTVAENVPVNYQGKRYIAYQEGFAKAESYAKEKGYSLYQTGGSVSTFAIDLLIRFGCRKITCVGLDLGYPNGKTHAEGIGQKVVDSKSLRRAESVDGSIVMTNKSMDIFRQWIERRIQEEKDIVFVNASSGARIHGMKEEKL